MKKMKLLLTIAISTMIVSCMPYVNTSLEVRQHIEIDKYWLGYEKSSPLRSNKLGAIAIVYETGGKISNSDRDNGNPEYTIYLATDKGLQLSTDQGVTWNKTLRWKDKEVLGVVDIYNDTQNKMIFFAAESGLYYKNYQATAAEIMNSPVIQKVESNSSIGKLALKKVDLENNNFRTPSLQTRTSVDVDCYGVDIDLVNNIIFVATSTGLYFSTDFFAPNNPNDAHWGNIIGKNIVTMGQKGFDYPQSTIPGALSKWVVDKEVPWIDNRVNYDPIYNPVYNPTFNKAPDYYAWDDLSIPGKKKGYPITWKEFATAKGGTYNTTVDTDSWSDVQANGDKAQQLEMRLYYETELDKNDYGNPNNEDHGVMRIYPYYRDMRLKATRIKDVAVYKGVVYVAGYNSGISYASFSGLNSTDTTTYDDDLIWETYTINYNHYPTLKRSISDARSGERGWSISSQRGYCINADENGIFYGSENGGIGFASTYKSVRDVLDINGSRIDYKGNSEYQLIKDSSFELFNINNEVFKDVWKQFNVSTEFEKMQVYYQSDLDRYDGVGNDNLIQGLRLNWQEYTTSGWSIVVAPGETRPIQFPVREFPDNNIRKIRLGGIGTKRLIYIATHQGIGVAEIKKSYGLSDHTKITASYVGEEEYSISFLNWGKYHKDLTQLGEKLFVRDLAVAKDAEGNDKYIYAATLGQGLVRWFWREYKQDPLNIKLKDLGIDGK